MGYTPNNDCVYSKAFTGCLAGLGGGGRYLDANAGDESAYAQMADAYAQELDTVWGALAPTAVEEDAIFAISFAVWRARSPLVSTVATLPGAYNGIVRGVIALAQEGNAQVVSQGIDPNGCAGGGSTGAVNDFVYQPGGTAHANVFTSWPLLVAAVNAANGVRRILVDANFVGGNANVPAGTWDLDNVILYGNTSSDGFSPFLVFQDGAKVTTHDLEAFFIGLSSVSTAPVIAYAGGSGGIITCSASFVQASAAAPFISVAADAGLVTVNLLNGTGLGDATNPAIQIDGAGSTNITKEDDSTIFANATTGTGNAFLEGVPGSNGSGGLTAATIQFPQLAGLNFISQTPTTPYPQNEQWLANTTMPLGLADAVTVVAVKGIQTANANTGIPANSFLGDATVPMPNHTNGKVTLEVVATIPATEQTVAWNAEAAFKNQGGISVGALKNVGGNALSFFGPSAGDEAAFAGATIGINITANGIEPQVTGVNGLVIDWAVKTTYYYTVGA